MISFTMVKRAFRILLLLLLTVFATISHAQDLEPRRWSHLPVGINVIGIGGGWTEGDINFNPVLLIEDATFEMQALGASYVRSFDWWGKTGRVDIKLPFAAGRWEGLLEGELTSVRRRGFLDPRIRLSWNLLGSPALRGREYMQFRGANPVNTTVGLALEVTLPWGDYNETKLINLGGNRLVLRPQIGVLHQRGKWQYELTGSVFFYGDNEEFWNGNTLEQDPLLFLQGHVIYAFKPGWWTSVSGGYACDGQSMVNGDPKPDDRRSSYYALSLGFPVSKNQGMKVTYLASNTNVRIGAKTSSILLGWSVRWGG